MADLTEKIYQANDGFLCISGVILLFTGDMYIGKFDKASLCPEGLGILFETSGKFTISRWKKGKTNGFTTIFNTKFEVYEGQMLDGKPQGEWEKFCRNNNLSVRFTFEKEKKVFIDFSELKTDFIEGKLNSDLDEICLYLCNAQQGIDYIRFADGTRYLGMTQNRVSNGIGIYIDNNFFFEYGMFKNGQSSGFKIKRFPSYEIGIGPIEGGKFNGIGYTFSNDTCYLSEFKNDCFKAIKEKSQSNSKLLIKDFIRSRMNDKFEFLDLKLDRFESTNTIIEMEFVEEEDDVTQESTILNEEMKSVSVQTSTVVISKPSNLDSEIIKEDFSFKEKNMNLQNNLYSRPFQKLHERAKNLKNQIESRLGIYDDISKVSINAFQKLTNTSLNKQNEKENKSEISNLNQTSNFEDLSNFYGGNIKERVALKSYRELPSDLYCRKDQTQGSPQRRPFLNQKYHKDSVWENNLPKENSIFPISSKIQNSPYKNATPNYNNCAKGQANPNYSPLNLRNQGIPNASPYKKYPNPPNFYPPPNNCSPFRNLYHNY